MESYKEVIASVLRGIRLHCLDRILAGGRPGGSQGKGGDEGFYQIGGWGTALLN